MSRSCIHEILAYDDDDLAYRRDSDATIQPDAADQLADVVAYYRRLSLLQQVRFLCECADAAADAIAEG